MRFILSVAALCLLLPQLLSAAMLRGRVTDSTGAALPGVTVEVRSAASPATTVVVTDTTGSYSADVAAGPAVVTFKLIGFASVERRVDLFDASTADATLFLSSSAEVVVTAPQTFRNLAQAGDDNGALIGIADSATVGVVSSGELARRPFQRPGEVVESVPGVIVSQHSGEGKANQYYLRGFNIDHGTDFAVTVAGVPVNMPTHGHGQGYADTNFLIPELIGGVQYKKGPYFAEEGDFSTAGVVNINYLTSLDAPLASLQYGRFGYRRALLAASPSVGRGKLLIASEFLQSDGPWKRPDDHQKTNFVLRYAAGDQRNAFNVTAMSYGARWNSSDQIPQRAISSGELSRFGLVDDTAGGRSHRNSLSSEWLRSTSASITHASAYVIDYGLDIFSNFTYFLDDPVNGDQFEQVDQRLTAGASASHRWFASSPNRSSENVAGVQYRRDAIEEVGLHRTVRRERLSTIRDDEVLQQNASFYFQNSTAWLPRLRVVAGVRFDTFRWNVASNLPENSGIGRDSIISPKLSVVAGPWRNTELYLNAGYGFHSNDGRGATMRVDPLTRTAALAADPLVRTRGAELGLRTGGNRFSTAVGVWGLELDSELLFVGDAGTTEATRPSRRHGVEVDAHVALGRSFALDVDYAWSAAEFRDHAPEGNLIPGSITTAASVALSGGDAERVEGEVRVRYFGPRPLVEDGSIRSEGSALVSARMSVPAAFGTRLQLDLFNALDSDASDIDYFYTSRLRGEAAPVDDIHTHPVEPRSLRVALLKKF